jgi:hypothetical protein
MSFEIKFVEGQNRGFLSNYLTILTSFHVLKNKGVDLSKICISPSMFMLYGNPANWFDSSRVSDDAKKYFNTQDGWYHQYPWASFREFDLDRYRKYFPYNKRIQSIIDSIDPNKYKNSLGVHYRGTDGVMHTEFVSVEKYIKSTEEEFFAGNYDSIFITTDQSDVIEKFLTYFKEKHNFNNFYFYDHQRTMSRAGLHYSIQSNPNSPERILAGDEVLIDAHTLSLCKTIIGKSSNITNYARILNPFIEILYQDLDTKNDYGDHSDFNEKGYLERFPQIRMRDIQPFIFNWNGQFEKTCAIEDSLKELFDEVTVINSDDNNTREGWIDLGDSAYFTSQFTKALELFKDNKKVLLHIQGDTEYDNWKELINDARKYYNLYEWGVYAPDVTNVWHTPDKTDIDGLQSEDFNIKMVACTDETVWFIHKDVIGDFYKRDLLKIMTPETMKMGWGWDLVMNAISFIMKRPVIRDYNHQIQHAQGTNYNKETASQEMVNLWNNLPDDLKECISYIKGDREKIVKYFE